VKYAALIGVSAALLGAVALVVGMGAAETDGGVLNAEDPATVILGEQVYADACASCHGTDLAGQADWKTRGPDGRLPAPPHDASGHTWHHDGDTLFRITKYGVAALIGDPDYQSDMPAYDGTLTDEEIIAVLSYIKSTWPEDIRARHDDMEKTQ
jgi:mono/diheme cytochrome c family protein